MIEYHILKLCITAFGFWVFWYFFWKRYSLDLYRQQLFKLRHHLFNLALDESVQIRFEDPIYKKFELMINNAIRFAHKATASRVLVFSFLARSNDIPMSEIAKDQIVDISQIRECDDVTQKKLLDIYKQTALSVIRHFLRTSPLFLFFYLARVFWVLIMVFVSVSRMRRVVALERVEGVRAGIAQEVNIQAHVAG